MTMFKLWYAPGVCSLASHIALRETNLPFDLIRVDIHDPKDPAHLPDDFRKVNPKKRVPVLAIDDEIITEAPAILLAISSLEPDLKLFGSNTLENVRVAEWLNWISGTLHSQGYGAFLRPGRYSEDTNVHSELRRQAKITIAKCYQDIEEKLVKEYAVGESFTVVDAFLFPFWRWGKKVGFVMEEDYPSYTALVSRTRERESVKAALKAEGIAPEEFGFSGHRL